MGLLKVGAAKNGENAEKATLPCTANSRRML